MENISQMSLLDVAVKLMEQKRTPQNIYSLMKEVLEIKGLNDEDGSLKAQLYVDIMSSSKFVFMGNDEWDLKIRQSLDEFDKDGSAFNSKGDYVPEETEAVEEKDDDDLDDDLDDEDERDEDEIDEDEIADESEEEIESDEDYEDSYDDEDDDSYDDDSFDEDKYNNVMDEYEDRYDD